ncbi:sigma-54-dependent Fis family transcriptional regulator [Myxococcus xanthus]|uniref:Sigma-54-dependent Fis family transcriptional regulator n=1 Tax=Myxococcus xanthus TaxID=34 RepID=A0A7Y4IKH4_MYXXA|nr:sigma 54-interacting transcriptional regulator [Myxococcus xanthus]NOJ80932.1 sigma-54-dependent Fis family transcriptional regulator [Myxococcus xanthus]NOJ88369.1 sigma-54-dependent Fis family transcriptional regulator [Myxococcus xanthus]
MGTLTLSASPLLWEQFLVGALDGEAGLRPELRSILPRWQRSRSLGAPSTGQPDEGPSVGSLALVERRARLEPVWHELGGMLEMLSAAPLPSGRVALLADREGVILATRSSGGDFTHHADYVRLVEGACWDETSRGTNAIGTALAESSAVAVVGPAHYAQRHHGLVCYAAPVHDPFGELVAVLDVTGPAGAADPLVLVAVASVAHAAEARLREVAWARVAAAARGGLESRLSREDGPVLVVEPMGRVSRFNASARALLGGQGPTAVEAALGVSWRVLTDAALRGVALETRLASQGPAWRIHAEAVGTGDGSSALAVLVRLESSGVRSLGMTPGSADSGPAAEPSPEGRAPRTLSWDLWGADTVVPPGPWAALKGNDPQHCATLREAERFAPTSLPVLLLSETGTGKELLARALHAASTVATGPFVAVNCGALSPALLESELFGHAPGAFTGARVGGAEGKLAAADGGTLFLDELAEMPPALQVLLLRVLEDGAYSRVGESRVRRSRFRLVGATCRDLDAAVRTGAFRSDLYFRLQGAVLRLPPLRERNDLPELAHALLRRLSEDEGLATPSISAAALTRLAAHPWPGNVRELKTVLRLALVRAAGAPVLDVDALPSGLGSPLSPGAQVEPRPAAPPVSSPPSQPSASAAAGPLRELEARAIQEALALSGGNVAQAARRLGIARSTLYRMAERFGITLPSRA